MLHQLGKMLGSGLTLNPEAFKQVTTPAGLRLGVLLFAVAVLSKSLGEAGILYINRASRGQYLRGLLGSLAVLAFAAAVWSSCVWISCRYALGLHITYAEVAGIILVSYFPLVFAFLDIVPHLGLLCFKVLTLWGLLITVSGLQSRFGLSFWEGLGCSAVGWVMFYMLNSVFGGAAEKVRLRLLGREKWVNPKEAAVALLERELTR